MTPRNADEWVDSFLATLQHYVAELSELPDLSVDRGALRAFVETTWRGQRTRAGRAGDLSYEVHGRIGCRLQAPEGGEVDVDTLPDGRAAFDAWRITQFAASLGCGDLRTGEVETACDMLVANGTLSHIPPGIYAIRVS